MKKKYADDVNIKLTTRPVGRSSQEFIATGNDAKQVLDEVIAEMTKYKPEALYIPEVSHVLPDGAMEFSDGRQHWSEDCSVSYIRFVFQHSRSLYSRSL